MRRPIVALALAVALAFAGVAPATAQSVEITGATARNQFPDGIVFSVNVRSDRDIAKVVFRYTIPPEGANVYGEPECESGRDVHCTFTLKSNPKLFLVPGANVVYYWEAEDADGTKVTSEEATFVYEDDRFDWTSISGGKLVIWYYGDESDARALLDVGNEGMSRTEELVGSIVDFPVKVFLYASAEDMRPAAYTGQGGDHGVITLGEVFFSNIAVVAADLGTEDVLRHELAHIVIRHALKGPFGNSPAWLDEGSAIYAQSAPFADEEAALREAIADDDVFTLRSMTSSSLARTGMNVSLFYGQAWSVVAYLIETYGGEEYAQLFVALRDGSTIDEALESVYGFDESGLDAAWRESVGLPPREAGDGDSVSTPVTGITPFTLDGQGGSATATPSPTDEPADESDEGNDGISPALIALLVVGTLGFAAVAAGGIVLLRRR